MMSLTVVLLLAAFAGVFSFSSLPATRLHKRTGVSDLKAVVDVLAGLAIQSSFNPSRVSFNSLPVAVAETKQGLYREYTVDRVDDSYLDKVRTSYKTAEQTEENKTKYWALFAVLLAGSFIIPMVQYYWYVAEED